MPSSVLQIIAMVSMLIDHVAYIQTYGNAHVIFLNYIGRIAMPIFCFQIVIGYKKTKKVQIMKFYDILKKNGINVTIRREFGSGVDAACGQLRANSNKEA